MTSEQESKMTTINAIDRQVTGRSSHDTKRKHFGNRKDTTAKTGGNYCSVHEKTTDEQTWNTQQDETDLDSQMSLHNHESDTNDVDNMIWQLGDWLHSEIDYFRTHFSSDSSWTTHNFAWDEGTPSVSSEDLTTAFDDEKYTLPKYFKTLRTDETSACYSDNSKGILDKTIDYRKATANLLHMIQQQEKEVVEQQQKREVHNSTGGMARLANMKATIKGSPPSQPQRNMDCSRAHHELTPNEILANTNVEHFGLQRYAPDHQLANKTKSNPTGYLADSRPAPQSHNHATNKEKSDCFLRWEYPDHYFGRTDTVTRIGPKTNDSQTMKWSTSDNETTWMMDETHWHYLHQEVMGIRKMVAEINNPKGKLTENRTKIAKANNPIRALTGMQKMTGMADKINPNGKVNIRKIVRDTAEKIYMEIQWQFGKRPQEQTNQVESQLQRKIYMEIRWQFGKRPQEQTNQVESQLQRKIYMEIQWQFGKRPQEQTNQVESQPQRKIYTEI